MGVFRNGRRFQIVILVLVYYSDGFDLFKLRNCIQIEVSDIIKDKT